MPSRYPEDHPETRKSSSRFRNPDAGNRIKALLSGRSNAWLSRESSVGNTKLGEIINEGKLPRADEAVAIARALETSVEWLIAGDDDRPTSMTLAARRAGAQFEYGAGFDVAAYDSASWTPLPELDLRRLDDDGTPAKVGQALVRRDEIGRFGVSLDKLWLARMPSSSAGEIGREGDTIICADAEQPLIEGAFYIFRIRHSTVVRKFTVTGNDWVFDESGLSGLRVEVGGGSQEIAMKLLGRILTAISYRQA